MTRGWLIALLALAVILGTSTAVQTQETEPATAPIAAVEAFYNWFLDYALDDEGNLIGNPAVDRAYRDSPHVTAAFVEGMDALLSGGPLGHDPFVCAQDIPARFEVDLYEQSADRATAVVREYFGANPRANPVTVGLALEADGWKIDSITCGETFTPRGVVEDFYLAYISYARGGEDMRNPLVDGMYRDFAGLSDRLMERIDAIVEAGQLEGDPLLCAQDIPFGVRGYEMLVTDDTARVAALAAFSGNPEMHRYVVSLAQEDGHWRIDDVTCDFGPADAAQLVYSQYAQFTRFDLTYDLPREPFVNWGLRWENFVTAELLQTIRDLFAADAALPADPMLCAQDIPDLITVDLLESDATSATVVINGHYPAGPDTFMTYDLAIVDLIREAGYWKLAAVSCAE